MTDQTANWQLPDGVDELLPDAAWRVDHLRRQFTDGCRRCGFELVMPPLIEYIDSLLAGTGSITSLQTFKVVDQQSGRTLGVRADMTPQVARIDAHVMRQELPTRLCYSGTVLRARTDGFGGSRTPQQFGAELFGSLGVAADIELIRLMLDTARITGLADSALVLSLGHVGVFQGICTAAQLSDSAQAAIFDVLHRGSRPDLDSVLTTLELNEGFCQAFIALLDFRGGANLMQEARATLLNDELRASVEAEHLALIDAAFNTIEEVLAALQRTHPGIRVVIDLAELRGYRYHNGMLYAAFTDKGEAIAQGGRYDSVGTAFGRDRPATGFSGDLTQLARLAAAAAPHENSSPKDGVYVPATKALSANDEAALWDTVNALRASGERVVMALPDDASHAASCRCERELRLTDGQWHVEPAQR